MATYGIYILEMIPKIKQESDYQLNTSSVTEVHALNPALCMPLLFLASGILPGKDCEALSPIPSGHTKSARG